MDRGGASHLLRLGRGPDVFAPRDRASLRRRATLSRRNDTMFQLILQSGTKTVFLSGSARSVANHTPTAACLIWGIALRVG